MNWEEMTFTPGHLDHHDQRITFPPNSVPGDIGSVVAVLNNITNECIQSSLEIVVSDVHPNFTVSCHGRDSGVVSRMIFHYNGKCCTIINK